jgi:UDP-glucose 4-epimerase
MKYLVTGGAGFIGSHLAEALVGRGDEVIALDNLSTGRTENLAHLKDGVRLVHGSVLDQLLVDELADEADVIVHLAAAVGVRLVVESPLRSFLTNIRGAEVALEAALRYGRKILLASTSEVYGKSEHTPFHENDDGVLGSPAVARWGYAVSKTVDEILGFAYHRERGLPVVIVRLFNTVGPRQTGAYGMVLPTFVAQAEGRAGTTGVPPRPGRRRPGPAARRHAGRHGVPRCPRTPCLGGPGGRVQRPDPR